MNQKIDHQKRRVMPLIIVLIGLLGCLISTSEVNAQNRPSINNIDGNARPMAPEGANQKVQFRNELRGGNLPRGMINGRRRTVDRPSLAGTPGVQSGGVRPPNAPPRSNRPRGNHFVRVGNNRVQPVGMGRPNARPGVNPNPNSNSFRMDRVGASQTLID